MYAEPDRDIRIRISVEAYRQQQHSQRNTFLFMHISLKGNMDFNVYYALDHTLLCNVLWYVTYKNCASAGK